MEELLGTVEHIVYSNEENGFTVAHLKARTHDPKICIVGNFPSLHAGEILKCSGSWKHHPQHGRQFVVQTYELKSPSDAVGIQKFLESGFIKGIGPVYAERIVGVFGDQTLKILDESPDRLCEVEGVGKKRIDQIKTCWEDQKMIRKVMIFLRSHGISASLAQKIYKRYGEDAIIALHENPYQIARDIRGVGFKTADKIAGNLKIPKEDANRIACGVEHALYSYCDEGHVCYPEDVLIQACSEALDVSEDLIRQSLEALQVDLRIHKEAVDEQMMLWARPLFLAEMGIARQLHRIMDSSCSIRDVHLANATSWAEGVLKLSLALEQKQALERCLSEKLHIVTGGPGTGKSTITKGILRISEKLTKKIILAAPTGKAAKRLSEITYKKAFTIHSLLEYDFTTGGFKRDQDNPLVCDLIIIDEASMIDTQLMNHLLKAIPSTARVIFIGDVDQLPSVGPGTVLKDLIACQAISVTKLTEIFRQAKGSRIITNAHRINHGEFPDISSRKYSDFAFIEAKEPEEILPIVLSLVKDDLPKAWKFDPLKSIQVLAPMKRGIIGIENLNFELQKALNPETHYLEKMGRRFAKNDKVMQLRNNYNKNVFNGDVGYIFDIDYENQMLFVDFDGRQVEYESSEMDELALAYACSIHKYQGSECPCIIIPVHTTHFMMLHRNLLYTGLTRGKRLAVFVGTKKAIAIAIKNDNVQKRYTGLKSFLTQVIDLETH